MQYTLATARQWAKRARREWQSNLDIPVGFVAGAGDSVQLPSGKWLHVVDDFTEVTFWFDAGLNVTSMEIRQL